MKSIHVLSQTVLISILILIAPAAMAAQELVFTVKTHKEMRGQKTNPSGPVKIKASGDKDEKPTIVDSVSTESITLAPSFFIDDDGKHRLIIDFLNKTEIIVSSKEKTYEKLDLHALAYFRVMECQNRKFMHKVLKDVKADDGDDFYIESLFGINQPGSKEKLHPEMRKNGDSTAFFYDEKERASYTPSQYKIDEPLKKTYARMIAQLMKLHPSIREFLVENNVPSRLTFKSKNQVFEDSTATYELKECKEVKAADPSIPYGYTEMHSPELKVVYAALNKLGVHRALPPREKVAAEAAAAISSKNFLDSFLIILEYSLSSGDQMTPEIRKIKDDLNKDKECQKYFSGMDINGQDKAKIQKSIATINSIDRSKLTRAYMLDIQNGNAYENIGELGKARELLTSVLEHNPLITGVYHDLGLLYTKSYQMVPAWECFKIGQSICPTSPMMQQIQSMDKRLETDFPELF